MNLSIFGSAVGPPNLWKPPFWASGFPMYVGFRIHLSSILFGDTMAQ